MSQPRGLRNNNPFNIRITNIQWLGKIPNAKNTDGAFEQFYSLEMGLRAGMVNMRTHISKGHNTLRKLINRHAPAHENPTNIFLSHVSRASGFGLDEVVSVKDRRFPALVTSLVAFENGRDIDSNFVQKVHSKYIL